MNTRQNPTVRRITLGAIFSSIGIILSLSVAYLDFGTGGFWLFVSLTAVYSYMEKPRYGFLPAFTIFLVSLLYMPFWKSFVYVLPPLLSGVGYGFILKHNYKKWIGLLYLFTCALLIDILGALMMNYVYHFNVFTDFTSLADNIVRWFKVKDDDWSDSIHTIVVAFIPSAFMLTAVLNMTITDMATNIFLIRLKLVDRRAYSPWVTRKKYFAIIYYVALVSLTLLVFFGTNDNVFLVVLLSFFLGIFTYLTLFLGTQALGYIATKSERKKANYLYVLGALAFILLMPLMAIYGSVLILKEGKNEEGSDSLDGF